MRHVPLRADMRAGAVALPARAGLTPIERQVVGLSLHDRLASVMPTGRLRRLLHGIFGIRPVNCLADPRLELLRVFCVRYRVEGQTALFRMSSEATSLGLSSESLLNAALLIGSLKDPKPGGYDDMPETGASGTTAIVLNPIANGRSSNKILRTLRRR